MTPIAGLRNQASRFLSSAGGQRADEKFTLLIRFNWAVVVFAACYVGVSWVISLSRCLRRGRARSDVVGKPAFCPQKRQLHRRSQCLSGSSGESVGEFDGFCNRRRNVPALHS